MQNYFQTLLCLDKSKTLQTHQQYIFSQGLPCAVCDCRGKKVPISCCAVDCVVCVTPARLCVCVRARADVHVTACSFPGYGVFRCACYDISVVNRLFVCAQHNGLCVPARSSHPLAYPLLPAASPRPPQSFWDFLPQLFPVLGNCTSPISPLSLLRAFAPTCKRVSARTRRRSRACMCLCVCGWVACVFACPCLTLLVQLIGFFLQAFYFFFSLIFLSNLQLCSVIGALSVDGPAHVCAALHIHLETVSTALFPLTQ